MTFTESNKWAASGAIAGAALIIYNPLTFMFTEAITMGRGYIATNHGNTPTWAGWVLHAIVLFFVVYGLLCVSWQCE